MQHHHQPTMTSHFTINKRAISSKHHLIRLTFHTCHTLLFSSLSLYLTCIYHLYYCTASSHIYTSFIISYFIFSVSKRVRYIHFIILSDNGCNTATESFQTNRLHRAFHSCYFHYSEYTLYIKICLKPNNTSSITKLRINKGSQIVTKCEESLFNIKV